MAIFSGKSGTLNWGGTQLPITSWSLTINDTTPSVAHSASSGWEVAVSGSRNWSASCQFLQQDGAGGTTIVGVASSVIAIGDTATLILSDGQNTYTGTGFVASLTFDDDIATGAYMGGTCEIRGSAAMTVAA